MLDGHSEAIVDFEHLICFMAQMSEKVLFKLRHRYVAFDMLSADRHRWGRPAIMLPTAITIQFSVKPPGNREDGDALLTLYLFPMAIMRSAMIDNIYFKTFLERIPDDLVPPMVRKAAAEIAEMEPAKAKSAVLSLTGHLLFALIVQPRHFFFVALNACEFAVALTTFCKAPFSLAFIELDDLWVDIDSLKLTLYVLAEKRPIYFNI